MPHVLVVQTGTEVTFPNSDNVSHHVYSFSPDENVRAPALQGRRSIRRSCSIKPASSCVGCNIHDSMLGYIRRRRHAALRGDERARRRADRRHAEAATTASKCGRRACARPSCRRRSRLQSRAARRGRRFASRAVWRRRTRTASRVSHGTGTERAPLPRCSRRRSLRRRACGAERPPRVLLRRVGRLRLGFDGSRHVDRRRRRQAALRRRRPHGVSPVRRIPRPHHADAARARRRRLSSTTRRAASTSRRPSSIGGRFRARATNNRCASARSIRRSRSRTATAAGRARSRTRTRRSTRGSARRFGRSAPNGRCAGGSKASAARTRCARSPRASTATIPAGTLLFWRGWSLHDRQSRLNDELLIPPRPFTTRPQNLSPFMETDHRPGGYAGLEWRYAQPRARAARALRQSRRSLFVLRRPMGLGHRLQSPRGASQLARRARAHLPMDGRHDGVADGSVAELALGCRCRSTCKTTSSRSS